MKRETKALLTGIILIILIVGIIGTGLYWLLPADDIDCLNKYAQTYCEENGMIYASRNSIQNIFYCFDDIRIRVRTEFYLLPSEIQDCRTKDTYSFRGTKE